jgi:predicted RNase H-like nuclease
MLPSDNMRDQRKLIPKQFVVERGRIYSIRSSQTDFITKLGLRRMPLDHYGGLIAWHEVGSGDREHDLAVTSIDVDQPELLVGTSNPFGRFELRPTKEYDSERRGGQIFIGVDLAWTDGKTTGIAIGRATASGAEIIGISAVHSLSDVVSELDNEATRNTVVAIDAPLVITNPSGARRCESEVNRRFGAREASCHSTNLQKYGGAASLQLVDELARRAIVQEPRPHLRGTRQGRWCFEVYPHPAQVVLFELAKTLKYKKGRVGARREVLAHLRSLIRSLSSAEPTLTFDEYQQAFLGQDLLSLRGHALKSYEDQLDACFCAYLALYYWYWGTKRNEMFGDADCGYIIVPADTFEPSSSDSAELPS